MAYEQILVEVEEPVGRIVFHRPDVLNAYSERMSDELVRAVEELGQNRAVRVVVVTGAGRAFMAGADISLLKSWTETPGGGAEVDRILQRFFSPSHLERCPKPVIAAVNGFAFGMGCEIALGCDIRIAAESAKLGQPEIHLGIMTGAGASQRLPRLVGPGKAMEMILTGDPIDAAEAFRLGLVNRVVPDDRLQETVQALAKKLAERSASSLRLAKEAITAGYSLGLYEGIANEISLFAGIFETADAREGIQAFLEKRKPSFGR